MPTHAHNGQRGECTQHALELLTVHKQLSTHDLAAMMRKEVNTARMTMAHLVEQRHAFMVSGGSRTRNNKRPAVWSLACHRQSPSDPTSRTT